MSEDSRRSLYIGLTASYIALVISGFVWIISGGLLVLTMMHIGDGDVDNNGDITEELFHQDIPVLEFMINGGVVFYICIGAFISMALLNILVGKLNKKRIGY